jgi:hypothetical protein
MRSADTINYIGRATAFSTLGFTPGRIKLAFIRDGLSGQTADYIIKEAFGSLVARGLGAAGKFLGRWGSKFPAGAVGATKALPGQLALPGMQSAVKPLGAGQRFMNFAGRQSRTLGSHFGGAANAVNEKGLLSAMGGGALEAGKGMFMMPGKSGLGRTIGQGAMIGSMGSMLIPGGGTPPPMPYGY